MHNQGSSGRTLLLCIAILGWLGLVLQLIVSARLNANAARSPFAGVLDALCYFTVLTNLLAGIVATVGVTGEQGFLASSGTRAATAVYIFVVGLIYALLLRTLWAPTGLHKIADAILHDLDRLCPEGRAALAPATALGLAYPLAYFGFSVVLGSLTGRYLYPFVDLGALGVATLLRNAVLLGMLFWILGLGAVGLDRALSRAQRAP
jgi:cellobiose-specific phosphotransferase system component IIC